MRREWKVQSSYGYWAVREYRPDEPGDVTYGDPIIVDTKKLANEIANALNRAYLQGREDPQESLNDGLGNVTWDTIFV